MAVGHAIPDSIAQQATVVHGWLSGHMGLGHHNLHHHHRATHHEFN